MKDTPQEVINGNLNPYDYIQLWNKHHSKDLSKGDIESEGWKFSHSFGWDALVFKKPVKERENYFYKIIFSNKILHIHIWEQTIAREIHKHDLFRGECKSINELRLIQKFLGI